VKIKIEFTIPNLDADAWAEEYGLDKSEVREDVRNYIRGEILEAFRDRGFLED